jgi:hypothetical protein
MIMDNSLAILGGRKRAGKPTDKPQKYRRQTANGAFRVLWKMRAVTYPAI